MRTANSLSVNAQSPVPPLTRTFDYYDMKSGKLVDIGRSNKDVYDSGSRV